MIVKDVMSITCIVYSKAPGVLVKSTGVITLTSVVSGITLHVVSKASGVLIASPDVTPKTTVVIAKTPDVKMKTRDEISTSTHGRSLHA